MRGRRAAGLVLSMLAAVAGCGSPPPRAETVRLLDLVREAELRWPRAAGERPPAFTAAPGFRPRPKRRLARLALTSGERDSDERAVLVAPTGSRYRFALRLPRRPVLRAAVGYAPPVAEGEGAVPGGEGGIVFRIRVAVAEGEPESVFSHAAPVRPEAGWHELEVELGRWEGEEVTLELETRPASGSPTVWGAWATPEIVGAVAEPGWDLVLISLDTLRADHLGCYGYDRPTSPSLDAFAAAGVRFATAVSASPWTRPAHHSLFTGIFPLTKGGLSSPLLAQRLRRAGWRTGALTGGGQLDSRMGFARGFDEYRNLDWIRRPEAVMEWWRRHRGRRRFLFLHTYEIHDPYTHEQFAIGLAAGRAGSPFDRWKFERLHRELTPAEQRYVEALYDGGIAFTDARLGALLAALDERRELERAIVVVTSDHGEQFFEHGGWRHGQNLYDHQLLVPLIVRLPPGLAKELGVEPGTVIQDQVQLVDLYPTLLELLGVTGEHRVHGRSLVPLLAGGSLPQREAFAEDVNVRSVERKALRTRRWKFVHSWIGTGAGEPHEEVELYDLMRDPGEQVNLAAERGDQARGFEELLQAILGTEVELGSSEEVPAEIDPELRERLEALGYVGGGDPD